MTRSLPLLGILLFLLLLNLVHTLENRTSRNRKKNITASPILIPREVYSSFNKTAPLIDHHGKKTSSQYSGTTKATSSTEQPSVTTIIIIQSNGQTYHELGGGPSSTNGGDGSNGGAMNDPNESSIEAQVDHDNEVVKRMISISTVVGGVGVVMIIAGTFIFIRLRAKRRRLKAINQLSTTPHSQDSDDNNDNNNHVAHSRHRRHFSSTSNGTYLSHHQSPTSPISLSTPQPTSSSPISTNVGYTHEAIEMSTIRPSAPPEPTVLPLHLRERHQQSLVSQQQIPSITLPHISASSSTSPAPSAPSAKELEMNFPDSSSTNPTTTHSSPIIKVSSPTSPLEQNFHQFNTIHSPTLLQTSSSSTAAVGTTYGQSSSSSSSSSSTFSPSPPSRAGPSLHLKPTAGSDSSDQPTADHHRPPLTPPPAYTPSAPPLFILPPSQRRRSADQLSLDRYRRYQ